MSKASAFLAALDAVHKMEPERFTYTQRHDGSKSPPLFWVDTHGRLGINQKLTDTLDPPDALRLRDWLTDTFDEPGTAIVIPDDRVEPKGYRDRGVEIMRLRAALDAAKADAQSLREELAEERRP